MELPLCKYDIIIIIKSNSTDGKNLLRCISCTNAIGIDVPVDDDKCHVPIHTLDYG